MAEERLSALGSRLTVGLLSELITERLSAYLEPSAESRELIAAVLDVPRYWPLLHQSYEIAPETWKHAVAAAERRARGAPLAYAVGRASFRSLTLEVDERVLIPRPETELLIDLVLKRRGTGVIVDVGTGSGAIAIALATEGAYERVLATDVSLDALAVARRNAELCRADVAFFHADLLGELGADRPLDVVVSNPPYMSQTDIPDLPSSVRDWEPVVALLSGQEGMTATARLVRQAGSRLAPGGLLALEVDSRRASLAAELVASDGRYENIRVELDLTGRERFVLATRREQA